MYLLHTVKQGVFVYMYWYVKFKGISALFCFYILHILVIVRLFSIVVKQASGSIQFA